MNRVLILIAVLAAMVLGYWYFVSRSRLKVEPHAAEEIEKAKRR